MKNSRHDKAKKTKSGDALPGELSVLCVLSIFCFIPILNKLPDMFKQPAHFAEQRPRQ